MSLDGGKLHRIGEVAARVGLSLRTVRYYEEMGLIAPSARTEGGFRLYSEADVERLELIQHMKPLGLSVQAMVELMAARDALHDPDAAEERREAARETLARFAGEARERVETLRGQLERAESFSEQIGRELRRHRRRRAR